jgi:hypothetical protein
VIGGIVIGGIVIGGIVIGGIVIGGIVIGRIVIKWMMKRRPTAARRIQNLVRRAAVALTASI